MNDKERKVLTDFLNGLNARLTESHSHYDDKLGEVFYPCPNAILDGLNKSMA